MPIQRRFTRRSGSLTIAVTLAAAGLMSVLLVAAARTNDARSASTQRRGGGPHASGRPISPRPKIIMPAAARSAGCKVTYSSTTWPGQFEAKLAIRNTGAGSIKAWKLTFTFPGDERISSAWNTTFNQTDAVVSATHTNYYDADIAPGASQSIGFLGTWQSNDAPPTNFRVNGVACR